MPKVIPTIHLLDIDEKLVGIFVLDHKPMTQKEYNKWRAEHATGKVNLKFGVRKI